MVAEKLYITSVCIYVILGGHFVFLIFHIACSYPLLIFLLGAHLLELVSENFSNVRNAVTDTQ